MEKVKGIIDRFEGEYAVIEIDGETRDFNRSLLPPEAKPGDTVFIEGDSITVDEIETKQRKRIIEKLMDEVWED